MYTKILYVVIDLLGIIDIAFVARALSRGRERYRRLLRNALIFGAVAMVANIMIALSPNAWFAEISYCIYFASIDWILLFLAGFCLSYTEHEKAIKLLKIPVYAIMSFDTVSLLCNPIWHHHFDVITTITATDAVFFQQSVHGSYFLHLAIDYIAILVTFFFIVYKILKSYDLYRLKYILILAVLLLVVGLNVAYMALSLLLDISIIFYAVAGTLIYASITWFVPWKLMNDSISRAVNDMNEGLVLFDISYNCIFANSFFKNTFGLDESTVSFEVEPMSIVADHLSESGDTTCKTTYSTCREENGEVVEKHYEVRFDIMKDKKGRQIGSYVLVEDESEEVLYLNQLNEAKVMADEANRAKSTFLANMSHEIRTPLNAVLGMNEMILRQTSDKEIVTYAENIRSSGITLLNLINDILDFSRIEARKMEVIETDYSLHKILRDIYGRFERSAEEKSLYLNVECGYDIPSGFCGDEKHIIQILTNIVSNAIKYTKTGGVTINADCERDEGKGILTISVSDTGMGIDEKDLPFIFDSFRRVNEKENTSIQGTGLGLAITKELVDLLGGRIDVTSTLNVGTCFTLVFTQKITDPMPAGEFQKQIIEERTEYKELFKAPDARVLAVDDVELNIIVMTELLRETEVQIDQALSGDDAIELCKHNKYDIIYLDHMMPRRDGIETFRIIRKEGLNTDTPVIMLTANALRGADDIYMKEGFTDYLTKPVDGEKLERSLIQYLPKEKIKLTE